MLFFHFQLFDESKCEEDQITPGRKILRFRVEPAQTDVSIANRYLTSFRYMMQKMLAYLYVSLSYVPIFMFIFSFPLDIILFKLVFLS